MHDQGGARNNDDNNNIYRSPSPGSKIIITVIFSMILGALFVVGLIYLGLSFSESNQLTSNRETASNNIDKDDEGAVKIIALEHEDQLFSYTRSRTEGVFSGDSDIDDDDDRADRDTDDTILSLFNGADVDDDDDASAHTLLTKKSQVDDLIALINRHRDEQIVYEIDEDFFTSGSVLVIAYENAKSFDFSLDSLYRDGDYDITAEASYLVDESSLAKDEIVNGRIVFAKIRNVQPQDADVKVIDRNIKRAIAN
ncbi:hypothetical protein IKF15_03690 [Candidatus Saccharibacteria bacterium]|nr:hypothetical protein [Candidatus Saccharibacteria bacterium]